MPTYLVAFSGPVWDQPDNPLACREVMALAVHAPTPQGAQTHAIRVTRGEAEVVQVVPIEEASPDLLAAAYASPSIPIVEEG